MIVDILFFTVIWVLALVYSTAFVTSRWTNFWMIYWASTIFEHRLATSWQTLSIVSALLVPSVISLASCSRLICKLKSMITLKRAKNAKYCHNVVHLGYCFLCSFNLLIYVAKILSNTLLLFLNYLFLCIWWFEWFIFLYSSCK